MDSSQGNSSAHTWREANKTMRWAMALLVLLATAALYLPGASGPFLFDDYIVFAANESVQIKELTAENLKAAAYSYEHGLTRPLSMITFALNHYYLGNEPSSYKLVNIFIHGFNAVLVLSLLLALLRTVRRNSLRRVDYFACVLLSLIWGTHPLLVSSVLYTVQRMELLSTTFIFLSCLGYISLRNGDSAAPRRRIALRLIWILLCVSLAMLAKETGILALGFIIFIEILLFNARISYRSMLFSVKRILAGAAIISFMLATILLFTRYANESAYVVRSFTWLERLASQPGALITYLQWYLLPLPSTMHFYYDNWPLPSPIKSLAHGLALVGLSAFAIVIRKRSPLLTLGIAFFFVGHSITSSVIPLELVFEHRNYLTLVALPVAIMAIRELLGPQRDPLVLVAACAFLLFSAGLASIRIHTWGDSLKLALTHNQTNPNSERAAFDLASEYFKLAQGEADSPAFSFAVTLLDSARTLPNASLLPEMSLFIRHGAAGLPASQEWYHSMIEKSLYSPLTPTDQNALIQLLNFSVAGKIALQPADISQLLANYIERAPWATVMAVMQANTLSQHMDQPDKATYYWRVVGTNLASGDTSYLERMLDALAEDQRYQEAQALEESARGAGWRRH